MTEFNLRFLNADHNNSIPFLPYGVTTIEFTIDGNIKSGYIRPENSVLGGDDKEYVGFADNNKDFLVVWGAGKEEGQHVKRGSNERMFMQLIHLKNSYDKATITFKHSRKFAWKQQVRISSASMNDVVRMKGREEEAPRGRITFEGTELPMYYSRWFPPNPAKGEKIEYVNLRYPSISIEYKEDDSGIVSPMEIFLETQPQKKKICIVQGDLRYSFPHAELFALLPDESIFVLRLWLYWIHKRYEGGLFLSAPKEETVDPNKDYLMLTQKATLEIPDIERFDFVIDAKKNKILWYGTDFHYQEHWGRVKDPPMKAKIAQNVDLVLKTLEMVPFRFHQDRDYYNPIDSLKQFILHGKKEGEVLGVEAIKRKSDESEFLAVNIRTHVPYVENGETEKDLISSDSRIGAKFR